MRLSANLIVNYASVNQFNYALQWIIRSGDPNTLYFQLVNLDQPIGSSNQYGVQNLTPVNALRYMAGCGVGTTPVSVQVTFCSIDDSKTLTVQAQQADDCDSSIWSVTLSGTQAVNSGNVFVSVKEGTATRTFKLMNALAVEFNSTCGSC